MPNSISNDPFPINSYLVCRLSIDDFRCAPWVPCVDCHWMCMFAGFNLVRFTCGISFASCVSKWMIFILSFSRLRHVSIFSLIFSLHFCCVCLFASTLHGATKRKEYLCRPLVLLYLFRECFYRVFSIAAASSTAFVLTAAAAYFRKETLYELYITFRLVLLCFSVQCAHRGKNPCDGNLTVLQLMVFNFLPPHRHSVPLPAFHQSMRRCGWWWASGWCWFCWFVINTDFALNQTAYNVASYLFHEIPFFKRRKNRTHSNWIFSLQLLRAREMCMYYCCL